MIRKVIYNKYFIAVFCVAFLGLFALMGSFSGDYDYSLRSPALVKILEINSDESLYKLLSKMDSNLTLLVLYTSWCGNCVRKMPEINRIIGANKKITPVIVSLDTDKSNLVSFLLRQKKLDFVPYNISQGYLGKLVYALMGKGIYFDGRVPYIAVMGKGIAPITNLSSIYQLRSVIADMTANKNE